MHSTVEDDLRFHLNCYRKNPPDSGSQERVTLGVATDWLPKAGVYSITSGDEPPSSHHMAPPPSVGPPESSLSADTDLKPP
jgi:hypothetical protein